MRFLLRDANRSAQQSCIEKSHSNQNKPFTYNTHSSTVNITSWVKRYLCMIVENNKSNFINLIGLRAHYMLKNAHK